MKWTYTIKNKTKAAVLLAIVLGLTMLTNLLERNRFRELEESFSSIYEDRLMAESYLFHLYDNLKNEQDLLQLTAVDQLGNAATEKLDSYRATREELIAKYSQTYLTAEEDIEFDHLQLALNKISLLEREIAGQPAGAVVSPALISAHDQATAEAFTTLSALSDIQTAEGAELRAKSRRIIMGSVSTSQFEMTILIIIAILIQALIFSSKTLLVDNKPGQNPSLN